MINQAYSQFCFPDANHEKSLNLKPLTERQKKVYRLKNEGCTVKRIAKLLEITEGTVYDALCKIKHKGWMV